MGLKVWFEFAGCHDQSEGEFLHRWVSFLCTAKHQAGVVHGLLNLVFFSNQGRIDNCRGDNKVEKKLFLRL